MADYTRHQKRIIEGYYTHRDQIMLSKLGEIVSDLYLADTTGSKKRLWERVAKAMKALKVPDSIAGHILTQRKPEVLAENLKVWIKQNSESSRKRQRGPSAERS